MAEQFFDRDELAKALPEWCHSKAVAAALGYLGPRAHQNAYRCIFDHRRPFGQRYPNGKREWWRGSKNVGGWFHRDAVLNWVEFHRKPFDLAKFQELIGEAKSKSVLPSVDLAYTEKVIQASVQREQERELELDPELAEIYAMIDAIDLSSDPFPVDLGQAAQWLGYSGDASTAKGQAKRALLACSAFTRGVDYTLNSTVKRVQGHKGGGAVNAEQIRLTAECFKKFCLRAGTKRAERVREYFIAAEQKFRAAFKSQNEHAQPTPEPTQAIAVAAPITNGLPAGMGLEDLIKYMAMLPELTATVAELKAILDNINRKVDVTVDAAEADQREKERRKLKDLHGDFYMAVVKRSYTRDDGVSICPCCNEPVGQTGEDNDRWEVDHWNSPRGSNRDNGWITCYHCNHNRLGPAGSELRQQYANQFQLFQGNCNLHESLHLKDVQVGLLDEYTAPARCVSKNRKYL